jgi:two-component system invasion response regulator UvrY
MIKVFIADDHALLREGLRMILSTASDIEVCGEAENGEAVLASIGNCGADVLLLDMAMPGLSGYDVLHHLMQRDQRIAVLVLSMYPEEQYALRFLKAGAAGYLTKESAPAQLLSAVRQVASGRRYVTPAVASLLADALCDTGEAAPHERLSEREYQVLMHIASGKTPTQIAELMHLSVRTISTYRSRILVKMRLNNSAEITHYVAVNHLL